jgi:putative transposase
MRCDFVEAHRGRWPVRLMGRVLRVSPGGYYDWRGRPKSAKTERREALVVAIKAVHGEMKARYGSPRIHTELVARGQPCCVKTVARLMREHGIAAKTKREFRGTTDSNHDRPVAENIVARDFNPTAANRTWASDIT